jgi:hypothetical protein
MQIIRKLIRTKGGSYILFIPKSWVENLEKIKGQKMIKMSVTLNGSIDCEPIFEDGSSLVKSDSPTDAERMRALSQMEVV